MVPAIAGFTELRCGHEARSLVALALVRAPVTFDTLDLSHLSGAWNFNSLDGRHADLRTHGTRIPHSSVTRTRNDLIPPRRFIGQFASRRVDAGLTEALFPLELDGGRNSLAAPKPSTSRFTNGCSRSA